MVTANYGVITTGMERPLAAELVILPERSSKTTHSTGKAGDGESIHIEQNYEKIVLLHFSIYYAFHTLYGYIWNNNFPRKTAKINVKI